jgi:hypothetical protein
MQGKKPKQSPIVTSIALEALASSIRRKKEKGIRKKEMKLSFCTDK